MRVLMVTQTYPRYPGDGTAPFVDAIARSVARRGHAVDVVLPWHPTFVPASDGIRFFPYRYSGAGSWAAWGFGQSLRSDGKVGLATALALPSIVRSLRRRVALLLRDGEYDVVHAHWALPNGWLVAAPARHAGVPLVISLHGSDISLAERRAFFTRAARRAFAAADGMSAGSDHLRRRAEALGAQPNRVETIRWGVDTVRFAPHEPDGKLREHLLGSGSRDDVLVAAVGRLVECKGLEYLIEAAARVPGIRVVIVGDGELRADLERSARILDAPVTFAGALPHDQVADVLAAADAAAVPFVVDRSGRVDGFGMTVLEALASARPLIATTVGAVPELMRDGVNGLLVPEKDVAALATALERLRDDPLERQRLGEEGRRTALESHTWDDVGRALEKLYERALRRHGRPAD
jgi:glycosyltransferase involved in cell wall biosynthesis